MGATPSHITVPLDDDFLAPHTSDDDYLMLVRKRGRIDELHVFKRTIPHAGDEEFRAWSARFTQEDTETVRVDLTPAVAPPVDKLLDAVDTPRGFVVGVYNFLSHTPDMLFVPHGSRERSDCLKLVDGWDGLSGVDGNGNLYARGGSHDESNELVYDAYLQVCASAPRSGTRMPLWISGHAHDDVLITLLTRGEFEVRRVQYLRTGGRPGRPGRPRRYARAARLSTHTASTNMHWVAFAVDPEKRYIAAAETNRTPVNGHAWRVRVHVFPHPDAKKPAKPWHFDVYHTVSHAQLIFVPRVGLVVYCWNRCRVVSPVNLALGL